MYSSIDTIITLINAGIKPLKHVPLIGETEELNILRNEQLKISQHHEERYRSLKAKLQGRLNAQETWENDAIKRQSDSRALGFLADRNEATASLAEAVTRRDELTELVKTKEDRQERSEIGLQIGEQVAKISNLKAVISDCDRDLKRWVCEGITPTGERLAPVSVKEIKELNADIDSAEMELQYTLLRAAQINDWIRSADFSVATDSSLIQTHEVAAALIKLNQSYDEDEQSRGQIIKTLANINNPLMIDLFEETRKRVAQSWLDDE